MDDQTTLVPADEATARKPRSRKRGGLFVNDAELVERLGVPEKIARAAIEVLDRDPATTGFPQKQALWGDRRYFPAVIDFFNLKYGLKIGVSPQRRHDHAR